MKKASGNKIVLFRVVNFAIAALCYILLFAFIFNVKSRPAQLYNPPATIMAVSENVAATPKPTSGKVNSKAKSGTKNTSGKEGSTTKRQAYRRPSLNPPSDIDIRPAGDDIWVLYEIDGDPEATKAAADAAGMPLKTAEEPKEKSSEKTGEGDAKLADNEGGEGKVSGSGKNGGSENKDGAEGKIKGDKDKSGNGDKEFGEKGNQYIENVLKRIEQEKVNQAFDRDIYREGTVVLSIKISKNGYLQKVKIVKKSGSLQMDEAAVSAVKNAAPFGKFPPDMNKNSITIETPIVFHLKEYGK